MLREICGKISFGFDVLMILIVSFIVFIISLPLIVLLRGLQIIDGESWDEFEGEDEE